MANLFQKLFVLFLVSFLVACQTATSPEEMAKLRTGAEAGDALSQLNLGLAYDSGAGGEQDYVEAAKWYKAAADQGLPEAQNSLGSLYEAGLGTPKDLKMAFIYYEKAFYQGHPEATNNLGYLYDIGLGVKQDRKKGFELYKKSAEAGFIRGMLNVGLDYSGGTGTDRDYVQAYKWLDLARFYSQTSTDSQVKWNSRSALDNLIEYMQPAEIEQGKALAIQWAKQHENTNIH